MRLLESKAELLQQGEGLDGLYKHIELCGRTCYKSTDKMTEDSAKPFVDRMIASHHTAMLEHGTVYLKMSSRAGGSLLSPISNSFLRVLYFINFLTDFICNSINFSLELSCTLRSILFLEYYCKYFT